MSKSEIINKLRNRKSVTFFRNVSGYKSKIFVHYLLNKNEKNICFQQNYSYNRTMYGTPQNLYLSLKDICKIENLN